MPRSDDNLYNDFDPNEPDNGYDYPEEAYSDEAYSEGEWEEYDPAEFDDSGVPKFYDFYSNEESSSSLDYIPEKPGPGDRDKIDIMGGMRGGMSRRAFIADNEYLDWLDEEEAEMEMRDYHPVRLRRTGRTGLLGGLMYAVFVISVSIILTCIGWMAASDVLALNKPEHVAIITVSKPVNIDDVTNQLKDSGIIEYKALFKLFAQFSDAEEKIDPGTYELSAIFDYRALVKKMQTGSAAQQITKITFPEGFTTRQIFERLEENNICSMDNLELAAATYNYSYTFLQDVPKGDPNRLEGYMFPDTYEFYEGEQASSVINKFLYNFYTLMTKEMLEKIEESGRTLAEIVNIASMIEREAGNDEERPIIASVIYNRLNIGDPLGIDATLRYILPPSTENSLEMTNAELATDSPYNTRLYGGLPPTPISCPGMASIKAAMNPGTTNYFFYALDTELKAHRFFTNLDEFNAFRQTQDYN